MVEGSIFRQSPFGVTPPRFRPCPHPYKPKPSASRNSALISEAIPHRPPDPPHPTRAFHYGADPGGRNYPSLMSSASSLNLKWRAPGQAGGTRPLGGTLPLCGCSLSASHYSPPSAARTPPHAPARLPPIHAQNQRQRHI